MYLAYFIFWTLSAVTALAPVGWCRDEGVLCFCVCIFLLILLSCHFFVLFVFFIICFVFFCFLYLFSSVKEVGHSFFFSNFSCMYSFVFFFFTFFLEYIYCCRLLLIVVKNCSSITDRSML